MTDAPQSLPPHHLAEMSILAGYHAETLASVVELLSDVTKVEGNRACLMVGHHRQAIAILRLLEDAMRRFPDQIDPPPSDQIKKKL